jgi:hypothetical protein
MTEACHPNNGTASSHHLPPPPQQVCCPEMASPSAGLLKYAADAAAAAADADADAGPHSRPPTQEWVEVGQRSHHRLWVDAWTATQQKGGLGTTPSSPRPLSWHPRHTRRVQPLTSGCRGLREARDAGMMCPGIGSQVRAQHRVERPETGR